MNDTFFVLGTMLLFLVGLRLSAFFSGVETGFYRISVLRLNIDSQAGDKVASRLLWFIQNPSRFVATCLVGNNVANYVTTLAVGLFVGHQISDNGGYAEVLATLAVSPIVFICGELLPKNLYFRAPMSLLKQDTKLFRFFDLMFRPISFPLIMIARIFERLSGDNDRSGAAILGRNRLAQVLSQGHQEGILLDVQNRMVSGLMRLVQERVTTVMTPTARIIGLDDSTDREKLLDLARLYGLAYVIIRKPGKSGDWYGYVRTIDILLTSRPISSYIQEMPSFDEKENRLEALLTLREQGAKIGVVKKRDAVIGVIYEQGLIEALSRA
jgi:CBS domain containing-hemolysin-like protein